MEAIYPESRKKKVELPIPPPPSPEIPYTIQKLEEWKSKLYQIQGELKFIQGEKQLFSDMITGKP
jgi:hypothetical protein